MQQHGLAPDERLPAICGLYKDRCDTTVALAEHAAAFYRDAQPSASDLATHVTDAIRPALHDLASKLAALATWNKAAIAAAIKETLGAHNLKMPQLAMPVRVLVMGTPQTPSLDAVLALHEKEKILQRLQNA